MQRVRFAIEWDIALLEKLKKLPKNIQKRITTAVHERLSYAPLEYGKPLLREWKSHRRIRVGDFRIIYKVFEEKVVVFIIEVDHRKDVYD